MKNCVRSSLFRALVGERGGREREFVCVLPFSFAADRLGMSGAWWEVGSQGTAVWRRARINWRCNEMAWCQVSMELTFPVLHWRICKLKGEKAWEVGRKERDGGKQKEKEGVGGRGVSKGHNQRRGHGARQRKVQRFTKKKGGMRDRALECCSSRELGTAQFAKDDGAS